MSLTSQKQLEEELGTNLRKKGFHISAQKAFSRLFHGKPDLVVEQAGKQIIIEVKSRPAMMSDVSATGQLRQKGQVGTLLCMPVDSLKQTPQSVRSYADQLGVHLCSTDEVEDVLKALLS